MPEKPEVITVCNSLSKMILNKTITGCNIYWDNIIAYPTTNEFKKNIINQKIKDIKTRGKFIMIELTNYYLLIHLRMEGKFLFRKKDEKIQKHEHVEFILDNEISFRYHDVRKFGKMYLKDKSDVYNTKPLIDLGYEFYDDKLTKEYLYEKLKTKRLPIKTLLLDQSILTGIGNIYADEILFKSKINPNKTGDKITKKECQLIIDSFKEVMNQAIKLGGTTIKSFTSSEGVHGLFQNELSVHSQKVCKACNNEITKIKIGGRSTYYCNKCQK